MRLEPFEHRLFRRGRVALETRFRKFEVLHDQVESALRRGHQCIRDRSLLFAGDIDRCVGLGVCLDELVGLIEPRVSDPVFPDRDTSDTDQSDFHLASSPRSIESAAFSAIMMTGALVLPEVTEGMTDASITRRPCMPCTRRSWSTTAAGSLPILHVPTGW